MFKKTGIAGLALVSMLFVNAQIAVPGKALPPWKPGMLDLHHISTGGGNAAYFIFPDGTTLLFDAGELSPAGPRANTARNSTTLPDSSKKPYEWIVDYIKKVGPSQPKSIIDYAVISHFHDDHFGSWYPGAPLASNKKYALSGMTGVGNKIPINLMLDRGYPGYNYPGDITGLLKKFKITDSSYLKTIDNYKAFVSDRAEKGEKTDRVIAGSKTQIHLVNKQSAYPDFFVRNIKSNGRIWTGEDTLTQEHFIRYDPANIKTWPDENSLSNAITINYGPFVYYTGGDNPGNLSYGDDPLHDVESVMAKVIGKVDVATLDHHGNRDAINADFVQTMQPRVWIGQTWSSDHPGHEVLIRMTTPWLYESPRDIFATNMLQPNRDVIGPLIDNSYKSQHGHVLVRVMPGGKEYYVIVLDDSTPDMPVKLVTGPYLSKKVNPVKLIGHRGGVVDSTWTENSETAMEAAARKAYFMIESDVRLTKDSQLILQHDPDLVKYYHVNKKVSELNWMDIRSLESDRDQVSPILFEDAAKYCEGRLQIMVDNKITGNDTASFRKMAAILSRYHLLKTTMFIGTIETREYFKDKAMVGCPLSELKEFIKQPGFKPEHYFLFEHGNVLTEPDVRWAQQHNIIVVPSVNKFHYKDIGFMAGAKRDLDNLKKWGVTYFQIDSEYDQYLK
jgi:Glycerophosphoryl diester phosphodiesterase family